MKRLPVFRRWRIRTGLVARGKDGRTPLLVFSACVAFSSVPNVAVLMRVRGADSLGGGS
jgi:hypothetical protein